MSTRYRRPSAKTTSTSPSGPTLKVPHAESGSLRPDSSPSSYRKSSAPTLSTNFSPETPRRLASKKSTSSMHLSSGDISPVSPRPNSIRRFFSKMSLNSSYKASDDTVSTVSTQSSLSKSRPSTSQSIYLEKSFSRAPTIDLKFDSPIIDARPLSKKSDTLDHESVSENEDEDYEKDLHKHYIIEPAPTLPELPKTDLSFDLNMFNKFM